MSDPKYIMHVVSEMDEDMIQRCIICGEIIFDYSRVMYPKEQGPPTGFAAGELYVSKAKNPQIFMQQLLGDMTSENCKP